MTNAIEMIKIEQCIEQHAALCERLVGFINCVECVAIIFLAYLILREVAYHARQRKKKRCRLDTLLKIDGADTLCGGGDKSNETR